MDAHYEPANRSNRTQARHASPTLTEYFLVATIMATLGVMAIPQRQIEPTPSQAPVVSKEVSIALNNFREAIRDYRIDHGLFPGYAPGRMRIAVHGPTSPADFRGQLLGWSDEWGNSSYFWMHRYPYGPYLLYGIPKNPENDLDSVRFVPLEESFPAAPDGSTGWIYKPETGELRMNTPGTIPGSTEIRWFDL